MLGLSAVRRRLMHSIMVSLRPEAPRREAVVNGAL